MAHITHVAHITLPYPIFYHSRGRELQTTLSVKCL